jgi:hypothetical protein
MLLLDMEQEIGDIVLQRVESLLLFSTWTLQIQSIGHLNGRANQGTRPDAAYRPVLFPCVIKRQVVHKWMGLEFTRMLVFCCRRRRRMDPHGWGGWRCDDRKPWTGRSWKRKVFHLVLVLKESTLFLSVFLFLLVFFLL